MMNLEINYDKVKLKYLLGVIVSDELDLEYALYELIHIFKDKQWDKPTTMKKLIWAGFKYSTSEYSSTEIIELLVTKEFVEKSGGAIDYYNIIKHPWK